MTPRGAASTADDATATPEQFKQMPGQRFRQRQPGACHLRATFAPGALARRRTGGCGARGSRCCGSRIRRPILVEGGFLTNRPDSQRINDAAWRQKLADAIADGVQSFQERGRPQAAAEAAGRLPQRATAAARDHRQSRQLAVNPPLRPPTLFAGEQPRRRSVPLTGRPPSAAIPLKRNSAVRRISFPSSSGRESGNGV